MNPVGKYIFLLAARPHLNDDLIDMEISLLRKDHSIDYGVARAIHRRVSTALFNTDLLYEQMLVFHGIAYKHAAGNIRQYLDQARPTEGHPPDGNRLSEAELLLRGNLEGLGVNHTRFPSPNPNKTLSLIREIYGSQPGHDPRQEGT